MTLLQMWFDADRLLSTLFPNRAASSPRFPSIRFPTACECISHLSCGCLDFMTLSVLQRRSPPAPPVGSHLPLTGIEHVFISARPDEGSFLSKQKTALSR